MVAARYHASADADRQAQIETIVVVGLRRGVLPRIPIAVFDFALRPTERLIVWWRWWRRRRARIRGRRWRLFRRRRCALRNRPGGRWRWRRFSLRRLCCR